MKPATKRMGCLVEQPAAEAMVRAPRLLVVAVAAVVLPQLGGTLVGMAAAYAPRATPAHGDGVVGVP
jgi:hypothetical protein